MHLNNFTPIKVPDSTILWQDFPLYKNIHKNVLLSEEY